ncbi:MAG: iron-sulfur cluster assembly scaffold protein [Pseudothermotoga sp.]|uniref:iron-sulfur cluster assembly scaffold protein n=1 Tax=Pseudothermotoga sp. TaxID=2033661 RepID=UPI0031F657FE|nr:iron-sulfur cluster assembly scaffold protein [Pseudothermotoga sp.]
MYSEKFKQLFLYPKYCKDIEYTHTAEGFYPEHGDRVRIFLKIENYIVKDVAFKAVGCPRVIAASEAVCRLINGKHVDDIKSLNEEHVRDEMDFHDKTFTCINTPIETVKKAIAKLE